MNIKIKNYFSTADGIQIGFEVREKEHLFCIDKTVPLVTGKSDQEYIQEAYATAKPEIDVWFSEIALQGKGFDPATGAIEDPPDSVSLTPEEERKRSRDKMMAAIQARAKELLDAGAPFNGSRFEVSDRAILKTLGVVSGVNAGKGLPRSQVTVTVRDKARNKTEMTEAQYVDFGAALRDYVSQVEQTAEDHIDGVLGLFNDSTKTAADIEGYDYSAGWPA